jgi:hypothetical protein
MHYLALLAPIVGALLVITAGKLLARQRATAPSATQPSPTPHHSHAGHAAL